MCSGDDDGAWAAAFFDEDNIVRSLQHLLVDTPARVEDLTALCIAAHGGKLALALSLQGLVPFAAHPHFVLHYAHMTPPQLRTLRAACAAMAAEAVVHEYHIDVVVMSAQPQQGRVDDELILFAAACILVGGLSTCQQEKHGCSYRRLQDEALRFHVNATVFKIMHACRMRQGAERAALGLLAKHGVACGEPTETGARAGAASS